MGAPDYAAAIEFLNRIQPVGPWALCCQKPDKTNSFTGARFTPAEADECQRWIAEHNVAGNQIWYRAAAINPSVSPQAARDADVVGTRVAWVDIDPAEGSDRDTERANILRVLATDLPSSVKPPTLIIDSGNGFQALYVFNEPWRFAHDDEREDFRAVNRWLASRFGASGGDKGRQQNASPHRLRDTFCTACMEAGVGFTETQVLMNHTLPSANVTQGYQRPSIEHLRRCVEDVTAFLLKKAGMTDVQQQQAQKGAA